MIAFGLSLVVFIFWGVFLAKISPPPQKPVAEIEEPTQGQKNIPLPGTPELPALPTQTLPSGETALPDSQPSAQQTPTTPAPEVVKEEILVTVTKGQTTLIFSSRGGVLKHIQMHQYTNVAGDGPIDLIPQITGAKFPLTLETGNPAVDQVLANGHFEPSQQFIEISESNPSSNLVFQMRHPSGFEVKRTLQFKWDDPLIAIDTQIKAPQHGCRKPAILGHLGTRPGRSTGSESGFYFVQRTHHLREQRTGGNPTGRNGKLLRDFSRGHPMDLVPEQIFRRRADPRQRDQIFEGGQKERGAGVRRTQFRVGAIVVLGISFSVHRAPKTWRRWRTPVTNCFA